MPARDKRCGFLNKINTVYAGDSLQQIISAQKPAAARAYLLWSEKWKSTRSQVNTATGLDTSQTSREEMMRPACQHIIQTMKVVTLHDNTRFVGFRVGCSCGMNFFKFVLKSSALACRPQMQLSNCKKKEEKKEKRMDCNVSHCNEQN